MEIWGILIVEKLTSKLHDSFIKFIMRCDFSSSSYFDNSPDFAEKIIRLSNQSFYNQIEVGERTYGFVLIDDAGVICGMSFFSDHLPFPNYYLKFRDGQISITNLPKSYGKLFGFYLDPEVRGKGLSKKLSLARLNYIKDNPDLFIKTKKIIAEIKGNKIFFDKLYSNYTTKGFEYFDKQRTSESIGYQDYINLINNINLSNVDTIELNKFIGNVYVESLPAYHMLKSNDFKESVYYDILDAGPVLISDI